MLRSRPRVRPRRRPVRHREEADRGLRWVATG